jgi:hypothetical protein
MRRFYLILGVLTFIEAPHTYGHPLDEIYSKEAAIHRYYGAINQYIWIRNRSFDKGGILDRALTNILKDLPTWRDGYEALAKADFGGSLDLVVANMAKGVRSQAVLSEDLLGKMDELSAQLDRTKKSLEDSRSIPDHPDFVTHQQAIHSQQNTLSEKINKLKNNIINLRALVKKVSSAFGQDFFVAKVKRIAIAKGAGDTGKVLDDYHSFIKAEVAAAPWIGRLERDKRRAIRHMIALEGQTARVHLEALKMSYDQVLGELMSSDLRPHDVIRIREELDRMVEEATERYQQTILPYDPGTLGQSMQRLKLRKYQKLCTSSDTSSAERCDLLAWLRKIDPAEVKNLDSRGVLELESKWQLVESPLGAVL